MIYTFRFNGTATKTKFKIVGNTKAEEIVPFDTCASGIQSFLAEAPNYIPQEVSARIMPASLTELIVKMKKI